VVKCKKKKTLTKMNIKVLQLQAYPRVKRDVYTSHRLSTALVTLLLAILLYIVSPIVKASEQNLPQAVGHVSLVIGQVRAFDAKSQERILSKDSPLYVGDIIQTDAGGHLHIRFIDDGRLSLRPNTRLNIESYDYNQQEPGKSAIRFQLEKGVVRSISGKATEAAHERFRLNTPITAIGVLGTDFLVRVDSQKMWAAVYSGAIAVSPLSDACQANGLGACAGALQITPAMNNIMFEYNGQEVKPKILPQAAKVDIKEQAVSNETLPTSKAATAGQNVSLDATTNQLVQNVEKTTEPVPAPIPVPVPPVSPLAWGRWDQIAMPNDQMTKTYSEARNGREVVFFNQDFILFKNTKEMNETMPSQGLYDLKLSQSMVYFVHNGFPLRAPEISSAKLDSASLQINFLSNQFNANFAMSVPQSVSTTLSINGVINQDGLLTASGINSVANGAVSQNGNNAALMFEKSIDSGVFKGITNWVK
jgi:hypothetical protein